MTFKLRVLVDVCVASNRLLYISSAGCRLLCMIFRALENYSNSMSRCHYSVHQKPSCKWNSSNLCSLSVVLLFTARATLFERGRAKGVAFVPRFLSRRVFVETNERHFPTHICILIKRNDIIAVKFHFFHSLCFLDKHQIQFNSDADNRERRRLSLNWIIFKWGEINVSPCGWKIEIIKKRRFVPPAREILGLSKNIPKKKSHEKI